jgi:hypothetical protein
MSSNTIHTIVLPRPSPGPEPIAASLTPAGAAAALTTAAILAAAAAATWRRGRRPAAAGLHASAYSDDPWIDLTDRLRASLVARFGPEAAAWTTPEWSTHPDVIARFGVDRAADLGRFARDADAARFGSGHVAAADPAAWRDRLAFLLDPDPEV